MKKRWIALPLILVLVLGMVTPVLAYSDRTFTQDTTLTSFINAYDNVVVKAGVTVTMQKFEPDPQGLEIYKSLTVEPGGKITGGGVIIFARGATCTGMDLYYTVAGAEKLLTVTLDDILAVEPAADYRPTFQWNDATGHYVLAGAYDGDPFEAPGPGEPGENPGPQDDREVRIAEGLKQLGLFQGSDLGFELDRVPTRTEAVTLLIRLLGKDSEARTYPAANCPFDDVAPWAMGYIGFAFDNGLTKGVSDTKFDPPVHEATVQQFLTFVLRAMGYSDAAGGDFTWDHPEELAMRVGILAGEGDLTGFDRGTCVRIMEAALRNATKDGMPLWQKLADAGVFTEEQYRTAMQGL